MARSCILYLKGGREHRSPWFTSPSRAQRALAVMQRRYGAAVMYRD